MGSISLSGRPLVCREQEMRSLPNSVYRFNEARPAVSRGPGLRLENSARMLRSRASLRCFLLCVRPFSGGFSVEKMPKQTAEQKAQTYTGEVDPDIDEAGAPARGENLDGFIDAGGGQPQKQRRGHMLPAGNISPQACEEKAENGELREVGQLPQNELPFVTEYGE